MKHSTALQVRLVLAALLGVCGMQAGTAAVPIETYAVPAALHHLNATARTVTANQGVLAKIGASYGDAYRLHEAQYIYSAPDRLEYLAHAGFLSASQITTNTTRITNFGLIHRTDDISKDLTKRQTLFFIGVLPKNYLETVRATYIGPGKAQGVATQVYVLRYVSDRADDYRRFQVWIDPEKRYVVQKKVWDGGNHERETIVYKDPRQILPGIWLPTRAEAYAPTGELGGVVNYVKITAN